MPTDTNPVAIINSADANPVAIIDSADANPVAIIDSADANPVAIIDSGEPDDLSDFMNVVTSVSTEDLIKDDSLHSVDPELSGRLHSHYIFFNPKTLLIFERPMSL